MTQYSHTRTVQTGRGEEEEEEGGREGGRERERERERKLRVELLRMYNT